MGERIIKINGADTGTIKVDYPNISDPNFEYYYRRGNRLYFRNSNKRIAFTLESIPNQLKRGNKYLLNIE